MPAVPPLPAASFTCPRPGAGERPSAGAWGTPETGLWERSQRRPALTEPGPAHPMSGAGFWGANPKPMGTGTLRDQEVFSGQGGVRTTIQQCCVALTLCCPLWPSLCACRKYLRDADRQVLAQRAFILTVKVLEDTLSELAEVRCPQPPPLPGGPSPATHTPVPLGRSPGLHLPPQWGRSTAVMSARTLGKLVVSEDGNTFPRCSHPGLPVAAR